MMAEDPASQEKEDAQQPPTPPTTTTPEAQQPESKPTIKATRLGKKQTEVNYFLLDMLSSQSMTHKPREPEQPLPSTPTQSEDMENSNEGGAAGEDEDFLQVKVNKEDLMFSPNADSTADEQNASANTSGIGSASNSILSNTSLPAEYDPHKPPPSINTNRSSSRSPQASSSKDASGAVRKRVVVKSIASQGKKPGPLVEADLEHFRLRMEVHLDEENDKISLDEPPISCWTPFLERNSIVVVPTDVTSGRCLIGLVNHKKLVIQGHTLHAGWNVDLPEVATISVRWEAISKRDPFTIIEDPKKGIARMNRWRLTGKEISFLNASQDPQNAKATFARVLVSKHVCGLIQQQQGHLLICGGSATAQWPANNGKLLDSDNQVIFDFQ